MIEAPPGPDDAVATLLRHPRRALAAAGLLVLVALALAGARLGVSADRMALVGSQHAFNRAFAALQDEFGDVDAVVALVSAPTRERARDVGGEVARRALARPDAFEGAFWRVPDEALRGEALLFLDPSERAEIEARLAAAEGPLAALRRGGLGALLHDVAARASATGPADEADAAARFELLGLLVDGALGAVEPGRGPRPGSSVWEALAPRGVRERDGFVWTKDGRLIVLLQPRRGADRDLVVGAARAVAADLRATLADATTIGLTGGPVLEVDETATFERDCGRATLASFVLVIALLVVAFRGLLSPGLALLAQTWAIACTLGLAGAWPGHLNLLTAAFCALLAGLGVGQAIHLLCRYDEARAFGAGPGPEAAGVALRGGGWPIAAGAFTTALAFMATLLAEVEGIREFGFLAGAGVVVSLAASVVVLPALLAALDRRLPVTGPVVKPARPGEGRRPRLGLARSPLAAAIDRAVERTPGLLLAAALVGAGVGLAHAFGAERGPDGVARRRLRWEGDLLRLQDEGLESVRLARDLLEDEGVTGMFGAVVVEGEADLRRVEAALRGRPTVARTESLLDVVPADQPAALASLARMRVALDRLRAGPSIAGATSTVAAPSTASTPGSPDAPPAPVDAPVDAPLDAAARAALLASGADALSRALEGFTRAAVERRDQAAADALLALQGRLERLAALAREVSAPEGAPRTPDAPARRRAFAAWEVALVADLELALARLDLECRARPIGLGDLPPELRGRFVGRSGKLLLRVYPRVDAWDPARLDEFLTDVRAVVPDVGGFPVQLREADLLLVRGATRVSLVTLCFVVCALGIWFRELATPLLAAASLLIGAAWAVGLAAIFRIELNPANLLGLPLSLGVGAGAVIHVLHRDREARGAPSVGAPAIVATSVGRAVILSSLAALASFGALACASHRGLASLGASVVLGVIGCLVASLVVAPALARLRAGPTVHPALEGHGGPKIGPGGAPT